MSTDFTTWERATLEQFAREARDKLVAHAQVEQQRDKLQAALQALVDLADHGDDTEDQCHWNSAVSVARDAIAEGGAA